MNIQIQEVRSNPSRVPNRGPLILTGVLVATAMVLGLAFLAVTMANKPISDAVKKIISPSQPHSIADCTWKTVWDGSFRYYFFEANVKNGSSSAIDQLHFYISSKHPDRVVPEIDAITTANIPGGIEPGETKLVEFSLRYAQPQIPNDFFTEPVSIGIVNKLKDSPLYKSYKGVVMFPAKEIPWK